MTTQKGDVLLPLQHDAFRLVHVGQSSPLIVRVVFPDDVLLYFLMVTSAFTAGLELNSVTYFEWRP